MNGDWAALILLSEDKNRDSRSLRTSSLDVEVPIIKPLINKTYNWLQQLPHRAAYHGKLHRH